MKNKSTNVIRRIMGAIFICVYIHSCFSKTTNFQKIALHKELRPFYVRSSLNIEWAYLFNDTGLNNISC